MIKLFQEFIDSYNLRDIESALNCFRNAPPAFAFGSGYDERRIGIPEIKEQLLRDWEQSLAANLEVTQLHYEEHDDSGWVAADLDVAVTLSDGEQVFPARASFFMQKDSSGEWRIAHMHFSVPLPEQVEGKSFTSMVG
jgi:ketosteroid isomerase-like protein